MSTKHKGTTKRRIEFDEEEPQGQRHMRWLAGGLGALLLGVAGWVVLRDEEAEQAPVTAGAAASEESSETAPEAGYALVRASWGSVEQPAPESLQPPPPPAEMTEEQRRQVQFAEEARQRWKGVEVFMRPR